VPGRAIIRSSWVGNAIFAVTALPAAFGVDALEPVAVVVALALFAVSLGVWAWAFAVAVARSAGGENIVVGNLFLLEGSAPKPVRLHLFGALGICLVITAVTASADPFGVLVPMLPIGLIGLWGARHGVYGPRPGFEPEVRPLRPVRKPPTKKSDQSSRRSASGGASE
jgi:hypothetical protein